jgi:hypothetical protein
MALAVMSVIAAALVFPPLGIIAVGATLGYAAFGALMVMATVNAVAPWLLSKSPAETKALYEVTAAAHSAAAVDARARADAHDAAAANVKVAANIHNKAAARDLAFSAKAAVGAHDAAAASARTAAGAHDAAAFSAGRAAMAAAGPNDVKRAATNAYALTARDSSIATVKMKIQEANAFTKQAMLEVDQTYVKLNQYKKKLERRGPDVDTLNEINAHLKDCTTAARTCHEELTKLRNTQDLAVVKSVLQAAQVQSLKCQSLAAPFEPLEDSPWQGSRVTFSGNDQLNVVDNFKEYTQEMNSERSRTREIDPEQFEDDLEVTVISEKTPHLKGLFVPREKMKL